MYFSFLGFYTMALIPPAFIGLMSYFLSTGPGYTTVFVFFSVFNLVWATIFLEGWKRCCSTLAYTWGTINMERFEEARADYHGDLSVNKITQRLEPHYPKINRMAKYYLVSLPLVCFCLWVAFMVMLGYFWLQDMADLYYKESPNMFSSLVTFLPSAVYAIIIGVMNTAYRSLAKFLNDWGMFKIMLKPLSVLKACDDNYYTVIQCLLTLIVSAPRRHPFYVFLAFSRLN